MVSGEVIFYWIGPIASFSDPWILNWLYSFGFTHQGVMAFLISYFMYYNGRRLLKELNQRQENTEIIKKQDDVKPIKISIQRLLLILKVYILPNFCVFAVGPIWMGVTSSATNPGMEYSFYLQFFVIELMQVLAYPSAIYAMLFTSLIQTSRKSSTPGNNSSGEKGNSFGYKIEDLNPTSD